jgi:hypothetical protein
MGQLLDKATKINSLLSKHLCALVIYGTRLPADESPLN